MIDGNTAAADDKTKAGISGAETRVYRTNTMTHSRNRWHA